MEGNLICLREIEPSTPDSFDSQTKFIYIYYKTILKFSGKLQKNTFFCDFTLIWFLADKIDFEGWILTKVMKTLCDVTSEKS